MCRRLIIGTIILTSLLFVACSQEQPQATGSEPPAPQAKEQVKEGASKVAEGVREIASGTRQVVEETVSKAGKEAKAVKDEVVTVGKGVAEAVTQTVEDVKKEVVAAVNAPGVVTYEASQGAVTFNHAGHVGTFACDACHTTAPPQKIAIDKDTAHDLCRGCHREQNGKAPTSCSGCHKK